MTPIVLIREATADGVVVELSPSGGVLLRGRRSAINRWAEKLRTHKPAIAEVLQQPGWVSIFDADGTQHGIWSTERSRDPSTKACELVTRGPEAPLTADEERCVRGALKAIGEHDRAEIEAVLEQCRKHAEARHHWLWKAVKLRVSTRPRLVLCGACLHFDRLPEHPRLGHCAVSCRENDARLWDDDLRLCGAYRSRTEN